MGCFLPIICIYISWSGSWTYLMIRVPKTTLAPSIDRWRSVIHNPPKSWGHGTLQRRIKKAQQYSPPAFPSQSAELLPRQKRLTFRSCSLLSVGARKDGRKVGLGAALLSQKYRHDILEQLPTGARKQNKQLTIDNASISLCRAV